MHIKMNPPAAPKPWQRRFGDMSFSFRIIKVSGEKIGLGTKPTGQLCIQVGRIERSVKKIEKINGIIFIFHEASDRIKITSE